MATITILLICSIVLNLLLFASIYYHGGWGGSWTETAAAQAKFVASISCSGHGRTFLDGSILDGKPVCECNACYAGPHCSVLLPGYSGDPMFLEPFWVNHAASSTIVVPGWHRMSYEFNNGSLLLKQLESEIRRLHAVVRNAVTDGRYIVIGGGATQLLHAAMHSLSD
ncbi:tryptophan aminotransferase-related protein 4-like [Hibiscus syriacus]|uniref:tryptophan aminotransferase-related protein 4-like n=1 Tax=Hibiscus syriacus TaxID=106335 RepID=UPI001921E719|nr:tryptophan aminotransferase-related protein 4-like [Hibiscus syriacus]